MSSSARLRCALYGVFALAALIGTQLELVRHFSQHRSLNALGSDLFASPAAGFASIDLFAVAAVALVFMVLESRRLGLPRLWLYIALTFIVAISVAFPLFLIERERHLARPRTV